MYLSKLTPPISIIFRLFRSSSRSNSNLSRLISFLFLLNCLHLSTNQVPNKRMFRHRSFNSITPISQRRTLMTSSNRISIRITRFIRNLTRYTTLSRRRHHIYHTRKIRHRILTISSFPHNTRLPLSHHQIRSPFQIPSHIRRRHIKVPIKTRPISVFPSRTTSQYKSKCSSITFQNLHLIRPMFTRVIQALHRKVPRMRRSIIRISIPRLRSTSLSSTRPTRRRHRVSQRTMMFQRTLSRHISLLPNRQHLLTSFKQSLPHSRVT